MKKVLLSILILFSLLILTSCKGEKDMKVVIELQDGREIRIELYEDIAPITVKHFLKLVDQNYYENVVFHRVIANFMIQAGGYAIKDGSLVETANVDSIKGEFSSNGVKNDLKHTPGVISMARTNVNDSASSQFFICSAESPHLDGKYAAFGKVIDQESLNVVLSISFVETSNFYGILPNFPVEPVVIKTIKRM